MKNKILYSTSLFVIITLILTACGGTTMKNPIVTFETNKGSFEVELYQDKAPISTANFLSYVNEGYYDGLIFHRVIEGFMVQGGGFSQDMIQKKTKAQIKNEASNGLKNTKYTLAMARTNVVDSATSQFFVNVADNAFLDHRDTSAQGYGYAVFGKVVSGTEVVDAIEGVDTHNFKGFGDVPTEPVIITKASVK